jgi:hypothetical protein
MVGKCANLTWLVESDNLRGGKVYLFEIDTATGAKRPEPVTLIVPRLS